MYVKENIFKIYDGRTNFWQWDTGQKLIVLDDSVTEVHFSNNDMSYSVQRGIYEIDGVRVCNVPNIILQSPKNIIVYAYIRDDQSAYTTKTARFAVAKRQKPTGYIVDPEEEIDEINRRLNMLENAVRDIESGKQTLMKFDSIDDAEIWAKENKCSGMIVGIRVDSKWYAYMVEDNYTVTPICNHNGDFTIIDVIDGGEEC